MRRVAVLALASALWALGCNDDSKGGSGGPDTDTGTDTDSDSDADSDADTDTDSDTDSDTDTGTDTGSDTGPDTDTCQSAAVVDADDWIGFSNEIAVGTDGLGIVVYCQNHGMGDWDVKVAHCENPECTDATISTVAGDGKNGHPSMAIGADGLPFIAYFDLDGHDLNVAHCEDTACTDATSTVLDDDCFGCWPTSVAIGDDGLPLIAHGDNLTMTHCENTSCTAATITELPGYYNIHYVLSLAIGADGLGVVAFVEDTQDLRVAHCDDVACTSVTLTTIEYLGEGASAWELDLAIGPDDLPVMSYYRPSDNSQVVAHCTDSTCTGAAITAVGNSLGASIAIGPDGFPVVTRSGVGVYGCQDAACTTSLGADLELSGEQPSLAFTDAGAGLVSAWETFEQALVVGYWDGPDCAPWTYSAPPLGIRGKPTRC